MISVFTAVVIYNASCGNSKTCNGLMNIKDINVMVIDNSTRDFGNNAFCQKNGWHYEPMGENAGLSKAYNRALDLLKDENGILVLFDDDTEIPQDYFISLIKTAQGFPDYDIFLPVVYDEAGLLSPCKIENYHIKRAGNKDEISQNEISGINSGMAVRLSLLKDYRYDESYFLDYIDHKFIRDMKTKGAKIKIFDSVLRQRFSDNDAKDINSAKLRFKTFSKDFKLFCGSSFGGKIYCAMHLLYRSIKLSVRYKSISFISLIF